ncbi:DUF2165 family protein [Amorphus orientalis]|uniref:Small integral membrane protein n=1 Tax=Amorphus orientalis TaxID=649198 RepID=A0AAE4AT85_9HYPH|nr:DUF2165 domain-containing protein [Amorphus orientalis]MDQ0316018.1 putative small integral membrane protein [Amorphus orientalis]
MLMIRVSKILLTAGLAGFCFLVTLGNLADYGTNWQFVHHVLSMDTIFPDSDLKWRAVRSEEAQRTAYALIIIAEGLTFLAFLAATIAMARRITASKAAFQRAKSVTAIGVTLGFLLWFVGFMTVGGEWFAMWQSEMWNGQEAAFRFYMTILAVGIYVFLDNDGERPQHL